MTACCPKDSNHKEFITVVHQAQDAIVDSNGNFLRDPENLDAQQTHGPDINNNWQCVACGATAVVVAGDHASAEASRRTYSRCEVCDGYISSAFSEPMFGL